MGTLSVANRQRVEIAKALSRDAKLLIMDEPTAALAEADVRRLMDVVRKLRGRGVAIIYVSHRMNEIFALSDRVTVLRDGALVGTRPTSEVTEASLVAMMVGREIAQLFPKVEAERGAVILQLDSCQLRQPRPRHIAHAAGRRDPGDRGADRVRPHRTRPHHLRRDTGGLGRDPARRHARPGR